MIIHVVQEGETLQSIADYYGMSVEMLVQDNGLVETNSLAIGQSLVIAIPEQTYVVQEGDSLTDIAARFNVTVLQLFMNNPYLSERQYLFPGDILVISYDRKGSITIHGNTNPNIDLGMLRKTLPYLTFLSILNYTATNDGEIITYFDDNEVINLAKAYGVMPLMLLTTLTIQGGANIGIEYDLLLNQDFQQKYISNILKIIREKGYYGVNISFQYINVSNIGAYNSFFTSITTRLDSEGVKVFVTVNPNISNLNPDVRFERVDYSTLNQLAQNIIFMSYDWATNINPPSPIVSLNNLDVFLKYVTEYIPSDKTIVGIPTIGYDWELPFLAGFSNVNSLTLNSVIELAHNVNAVIHFDEVSQTPYFQYSMQNVQHIVWFVDARSINALLDLVVKYNLHGSGIWNITVYNPQLWLIVNSQFNIEKISV